MVAAIGAILSSLLAYLVFNLTTNRNRAYDMARSMTSQLRDSESRLRSVLSSAADGILTIDASGTVESANPAALHIFGHSSETMRGALLKVLIDGHDADHLEHIVLTQGNAVTGSTRFEALARAGKILPVDVSLGITTSDGQRCYTLIVTSPTPRWPKPCSCCGKGRSVVYERYRHRQHEPPRQSGHLREPRIRADHRVQPRRGDRQKLLSFLQGEATSQSAIKELSSAIRESRDNRAVAETFAGTARPSGMNSPSPPFLTMRAVAPTSSASRTTSPPASAPRKSFRSALPG